MGPKKKGSAKDAYERQKELARLRQRRRKERMTEEEKEAKRKYDRERVAKLREEKKIKRIGDMTPREKRKMRKYWRERHKIQKTRTQALETVVNDTPPASPDIPNVDVEQESIQKKRGRKQVRRDKAKAYRTVKKQKARIDELERKIEKYKKRLQREKKKINTVPTSPSPRKQLKDILGKEKVSPNVKKQLFLGLTLKKQVAVQLKQASHKKKKIQVLRKVLGNKILKKYRVQKYFTDIIPYKSNKALANSDSFDFQRTKKKAIRHKLSVVLTNFFENDTVSRMCPGKKDTVKKGRLTKQRRVLLDTVENLHTRFQNERKLKISRTTFYRSRPFWVTFPKMSDRDTCACIKHANMSFLISALKNHNIIEERSSKEVVQSTVCSAEDEICMMNKCKTCEGKRVNFKTHDDFTLKFSKWITITEEKSIKNKQKIVKKTVKSTERKKVSEVKEYLHQELVVFKKHVFYAKHQEMTLQKAIKEIKPGTLILRIDFSENYVTKFQSEVQSVHFGASKKQMALHTGILYTSFNDKVQTITFATASDNIDHQAHAVWAHMKPILQYCAEKYPNTETLHFFSDSPSSQYRNRKNVYLMKNMVPEYFQNLQTVTWNWTEAGHGKGPMDGVGGTLKRGADKKVLHGQDITNAKDFLAALKDYGILMFEILSSDVERLKHVVLGLKIPPIKGIMDVHQVTWCEDGKMQARTLSCFSCTPKSRCDHYYHSEVKINCNISGEDEKRDTKEVLPKTKLSVHDVFTSSEDDEAEEICPSHQDLMTSFAGAVQGPVMEKGLFSGVYIIVEYTVKKGKPKQFIGVCQSQPMNNEVDVLFLKPCSKDDNLFIVDEKDFAAVPVNQIKAIVPSPRLILKGNRVYYKFKKLV